MKLQLSRIVLDDKVRARGRLDPINVHRLVTAYQAGARFPALVIEAKSRRLVDGWHRHKAYQILDIGEIEVEARTYKTEAEFFIDAVRLNIGHGVQLSQYDIKQAIVRLGEFGIQRVAISEIIRVPGPKIEKLIRGFAETSAGKTIPLKRGLGHMRGQQLSAGQIEAMRSHGGHESTYYARQLITLIETDLWPRDNPNFYEAMNHLAQLWVGVEKGRAA